MTAAAVVKFLLMSFLVYVAIFVMTRVLVAIDAVRQFDDKTEHAKNHCHDFCMKQDNLERSGEYAANCPDACDRSHIKSTAWEVGLKAVSDITYLCLDYPCEEVFHKFVTFKVLLFMLVMAYGFRFTLVAATNGGKTNLVDSVMYVPNKLWNLVTRVVGTLDSEHEKSF
jgi:hypothetical protein